MDYYLKLKKSNCKNCYKCLRNCPVKSIRFSDTQAHIVKDDCILCGQCFVVCPQNAKEIRNDVSIVREFIEAGEEVYVSLAPAFVANYDGATIESMRNILKKLGVTDVEETAVGATIVKKSYEEMIELGEQKVIISSCCHTVNLLIQKYYPEALKYLAQVISPMQAHCMEIKKAHPNAKTVFIGPCISKKSEAEQYKGIVDVVLTFEELSQWMLDEGIEPQTESEISEDSNDNSRARLFPTSGGILRTMDCNNKDYAYLEVDGIENCINALKDIVEGSLTNCFIEMSSCIGSCIGGPGMDKGKISPIRDYMKVNRYAGKNDYIVPPRTIEELKKDIQYIGINRQMPGSKAIEEILHQMGKTKPEDELNCGSCGYNTCREKAVAVLFGKANLKMCLPFLKEKAESFSDNIIKNTPNAIIVLNEEMEVQQINKAALKIMNIKRAADVLGEQVVRILEPQVFLDVYSKGRNVHDMRVYLAEYQKYVEQTVIYDKNYHIIMCIMRDVTEEELAKENREEMSRHTIEITDKVIDKQMRVVQEIALLLGETTAETKIALTNLKESLGDE